MSVKTIVNPNTGQQVKLGRNKPTTRHICSSMKQMMDAGVLPDVKVPESSRFGNKAMTALSNCYMNQTLGCCVCSGIGHIRGVTSFNSNQGIIFTDDQIIEMYSAIGGYNPNAPLVNGENPTDQGCDENTALNYLKATGYPDGVKLLTSISLNPHNIAEYRLAMYLFENVMFGLSLPDAWISPFPSEPGYWWDKAGPPDPNNGHCIVAVDLAPHSLRVDSWGMIGSLSNAAIEYYGAEEQGGQMFALLLPDIVSKISQKSPDGYDITALEQYIASL